MWDIKTACEKVMDYFIEKRKQAPHCVVCDRILYNYRDEIFNYLYLLEVKDRKITYSMIPDIINYIHLHYPYAYDKSIYRHHVNYAKNIQVPTCGTCHNKIHHKNNDPKYAKWKPVDKKPKGQIGFKTNLYKPIEENPGGME